MCITLLTIGYAFAYAQEVSPLNSIIHLPSEKLSLRDFFRKIEQQTDILVVYNNNEIDTERIVNFGTQTGKISSLLSEAFHKSNIKYTLENDYLILSQNVSAEKPENGGVIRGRVSDANGEFLHGTLVKEKGTGNVVVTDTNGGFSITLRSGKNAVLEVSCLGKVSREIEVSSIIPDIGTVVLADEDRIIDGLVVIGYGTQKRANLTGAVTTVSYDNVVANSRPITSTSASLAGAIPGVQIRQTSGTPGADGASILIRGDGSLNGSTAPLILIDGQPGDMDQVSANDIADITVLKDAASAAIYGSRGSNGVILVTTKSGANTNGKIDFNYTGSVGWNNPTKLYNLVSNTADHMKLTNMIVGGSGTYTDAQIAEWREKSKTDPLGYPNTDWWSALLQTSMIHTHQFSLRGGNEKISSYTSANYQQNNGLMSNTSYDVWNVRTNVDYKVNDWLKISTVLTGMVGVNDAADIGGVFTWFSGTTPAVVPKAPDGRYGDNQTGSGSANNLLWILERAYGEKRKRRFNGKFGTEVKPAKGLTINASYFRDMYNYQEDIITSDPIRWDFQRDIATTTGSQGIIEGNNSNADYFSFDFYATYEHSFVRNHNFRVMLGYNADEKKEYGTNLRKSELLSLLTPVLNAASEFQFGGGYKNSYANQSVFGRINYDYNSKYLLEVNWRYDGTSKLPPATRWQHLPGFSAGWRISEEGFWDGNLKRALNNLKLRVSWGKLGNNGIGNYDWQSVYNADSWAFDDKVAVLLLSQYGNNQLYWETTRQLNIGLDISFINKITLSIDAYDKMTTNILSRLVLPEEYGGVAGPMSNGPKLRNRGIELQADYHDRFGKVIFSAGFNGAYNQNRIMSYNNGLMEIRDGNLVWMEGHPKDVFYLLEVGKIVQDKTTEIDPLVLQGWTFSPSTPGNGDFLYKNNNGDKRIDLSDRVLMGNPQPLFNFGGYIRTAYAGFDLSVNFNGVLGWDRYLTSGVFSLNTATEQLYLKDHLNMWTEENRNTTIPRIYRSNDKNDQPSDYHLYDASYVRIKTMQLGYTFPLKWTSRIHINHLRAYVNFENFFTFTSYPGLDPEMSGYIGYPTLKTVSMGLNLKF